ncbi:hypothetical protein, partial [Streptomyces sp. NPDC127084]|uniref:hypothetical protein n=1 Tax=Streptomyces sp. NPDC127084 TaxID=3347133 RepID=UPI0036547706
MFDSVELLTGSPWIYAVVALSVLLDVFLPVLPSGALVITAATAAAAGSTAATAAAPAGVAAEHAPPQDVPSLLALLLCATTASVLGDLVAYRVGWRGGVRLVRGGAPGPRGGGPSVGWGGGRSMRSVIPPRSSAARTRASSSAPRSP